MSIRDQGRIDALEAQCKGLEDALAHALERIAALEEERTAPPLTANGKAPQKAVRA